MTAAKDSYFEEDGQQVMFENDVTEKSMSTKIGEFIGRHLIGFTFLSGLLIGSSYTKCKMNRQFNRRLSDYEKMVTSLTGIDTKFI